MNETIKLECHAAGIIRLGTERSKGMFFSTPNHDGSNFETLYADIKEGDIIEITFKNIRICSQCGKQLDDKK